MSGLKLKRRLVTQQHDELRCKSKLSKRTQTNVFERSRQSPPSSSTEMLRRRVAQNQSLYRGSLELSCGI